ncbi:MAG: glycosyltransferase family 4 protein [Prolixibacteraceae bacterium]
MKILFLSDNFPPEVNAPATRTYEHCREWVKLGARVTVITCFPNFPQGKIYNGYKNQWKKTEWIDGIKVIRVLTYISANEGFVRRTLDFISFSVTAFFAGLFESTDVIVATSPQFFTALAGRTLSFWKRKPWIMEVRDLWPESIKTVGAMKDNLFIRYFELEEQRCYRSASGIIALTNSFKENIVAKGISHEKIEVVKNGANLDLYQPRAKNQEIVNALNLEGKIVLGYIGTFGMAHKLDFILDCAKQLIHTNYHFLLMGDGAERKRLRAKTDAEKITNVTILEAVAKTKVADYLSVVDISLINLRKSDLFKTVIPSKIFESAAMQIPILMGVDGEARSIIEEFGAGLFFEPESTEDFILKLEQITRKERYSKCREGGANLAKAYDRKQLACTMLKFIIDSHNMVSGISSPTLY